MQFPPRVFCAAAVISVRLSPTPAHETTKLSVRKVWGDGINVDGKRPKSVTFALPANGEETGQTLVLNNLNHWSGTFRNLDRLQNGKPNRYCIAELEVPDYAVSLCDAATDRGPGVGWRIP